MKLFACPACAATVHFENSLCTACGVEIGFAPGPMEMVAPDPDGVARTAGQRWRKCRHYAQLQGCTWMVADDAPFCLSCRLNRTIPDLSVAGNAALWQRLEDQKRRLIYALLRLGLPVAPRDSDPAGLAFDFLADPPAGFSERVLTGHADGLITLNIAEADPAAREAMRADMDEPYRTILGHFRHESGHYYWDRLVRDSGWLGPFRALFGDERADYAAALQTHYQQGPPPDWAGWHVSAYAASHPWEDWAESWSHYLHLTDTLETAWAFGLRLGPHHAAGATLGTAASFDPYQPGAFDALYAQWVPLTLAMNALNRSMGHAPAYPFALAPPAVEKLAFIHRVIHTRPPGS